MRVRPGSQKEGECMNETYNGCPEGDDEADYIVQLISVSNFSLWYRSIQHT